ncbi:MAG: hypothetical protein U9O78_04840 [Patescibacteria group bacterium]|nr:hypothetical protein [Patescibacteria group bacterium]
MTPKKIIASIVYCLPFFLILSSTSMFILFALGVFFGLGLLEADQRYFYRYYSEKKESESETFLATRSFLFLLTLIPLSIFVITSTMSMLGIGMIMGILLNLLIEMTIYRAWPQAFKKRFLDELKVKPTFSLIAQVFVAGLAFFILMNLLIIF